MGAKVSRSDFDWTYTEEPHKSRREQILKEHPEIKQLFGLDRSFKYVVLAIVITQVIICYLLRDADWTLVFLQAYFAGGVMNHALTLAVHEVSHNMAFGTSQPLKNRIFGMIANLPIGLPMSISFKKYHLEHHRYMGEDVLDTDIPTELEAKLFQRPLTKLIWLFFQPFFYSFRPLIVYKKAVTDLEVINAVIQIAFNVAIVQYCGWKAMVYLLFGTMISMGWHPVAGHFISEHYVFNPGQETYSYYGPLNLVTFNVGCHVEHHDFPFIPGDRLPQVRQIAPSFYSSLTHHTSWTWVLYQFVVNPSVGPYARLKRKATQSPDFKSTNMQYHVYEYIEAAMHYLGLVQLKGFLCSCLTPTNRASEKIKSVQ